MIEATYQSAPEWLRLGFVLGVTLSVVCLAFVILLCRKLHEMGARRIMLKDALDSIKQAFDQANFELNAVLEHIAIQKINDELQKIAPSLRMEPLKWRYDGDVWVAEAPAAWGIRINRVVSGPSFHYVLLVRNQSLTLEHMAVGGRTRHNLCYAKAEACRVYGEMLIKTLRENFEKCN